MLIALRNIIVRKVGDETRAKFIVLINVGIIIGLLGPVLCLLMITPPYTPDDNGTIIFFSVISVIGIITSLLNWAFLNDKINPSKFYAYALMAFGIGIVLIGLALYRADGIGIIATACPIGLVLALVGWFLAKKANKQQAGIETIVASQSSELD